MSSVNKVILIGNLGADPEMRSTQAGRPVCSLRIATGESWTDKSGQQQDRTEWHNVTVWDKQAELCAQYLAKGRSVYIEGRIQSREYQANDGSTRKAFDIVAKQVTFLGGQQQEGRQSKPQQQTSNQGEGWGNQQRQPQQHPQQQQQGGWNQNESIPF